MRNRSVRCTRWRKVFDPDERVNPGKVVPVHACREWASANPGAAPRVSPTWRGHRDHSRKVTALLGEGAVLEPSTDRVPRIAPGSPDAVALLLGTAHEEGWRVRIEGAGTCCRATPPRPRAHARAASTAFPAIEPSDLTATAEAGIGLDQLRQQLADRGAWLAIDPPGLAGRTLGLRRLDRDRGSAATRLSDRSRTICSASRS